MEASTILFIHEHLTDFFSESEDPISPPGVKNIHGAESAAARPFSTAGGNEAYPTPFLKAASLFHSIAGNHAFHNGNKRAALLSTIYFLGELGYLLDGCSDDEMYEFTRKIAAHEISDDRRDEVNDIAIWLEKNSRRQIKGDKPMKLSALRDILGRFGYTLEDQGYTLDICDSNGVVVFNILKKGAKGFADYDPPYMSTLRKRLNLTADDGVDSARFYGHTGIADELSSYTKLRIDVMKRLAKI
ncbi:type II toxin-antitoxin system death-on-curing family toxin [Aeromonas media]|uniref:type II toxin-antitoxin system death-on-curing family toxin n=1 Tax=Aeromonas media TaxID=651 RepID=UPI003D19067D